MSKRVLIIGANSDIGQCCADLYAAKGCKLILAAHKPEELSYADAEMIEMDLNDVEEAVKRLEDVSCDIVLYCAGRLTENESALFTEAGESVRNVNYNAPVAILGRMAGRFKERGSGVIAGISSVAADRGKASNVVYGSAKAGFDHFLSGLRQYVHPYGVRVLTIRPGYVDTKMTRGMELPKSLTASPEAVAASIVKNTLGGSRNIVYVKAIWRPLMWILKHIPERFFKRKAL